MNRRLHITIVGALWGLAVFSAVPKPPVFVDAGGVLRDTKTRKELAFFGVNYTVPFAYGFRAVRYTADDHEKIIDQDVYHLSRLGINAFRVHIWDTEISDTLGNLLLNEHLRLFDYLLGKFKERGIKTMITPIAFWGNGYPERDQPTPGFSYKYGKGNATRDEAAMKAQENFLKQFVLHKNPYTGLTYLEDPDIILLEINNEPSHGNAEQTARYIQRMAAAVRSEGWNKPVLYNIAQNSGLAGTVLQSPVEGITFQWYPSGLVRNSEQKGNFLPHVDRYSIPFSQDPLFLSKMKATYEFDAADIMLPLMYPAMARSFRQAGFQWTTQFAYDPVNTAFANTEYQTHYLNLVYTPQKAISLLIAGEAYRNTPRGQKGPQYPADSIFGAFRLSYAQELCEMNTAQAFYHSGSTQSRPVAPAQLSKIAGVGHSPLVTYPGSGAYFLDKIADGIWRLEVYPDAVPIRDPFERTALTRETTRIEWKEYPMELKLENLGKSFSVTGLNEGNDGHTETTTGVFTVRPGAWLLVRKGREKHRFTAQSRWGNILLGEFSAPPTRAGDKVVRHTAPREVNQDGPWTIQAYISGVAPGETVQVQMSRLYGGRERLTFPLVMVRGGLFEAAVPQRMLSPGIVQYSILDQTWTTRVVPASAPLVLYDAQEDYASLNQVSMSGRTTMTYSISEQSGKLFSRTSAERPDTLRPAGWELFVGEKCSARKQSLKQLHEVVVRARSVAGKTTLLCTLIDRYGTAFAARIPLGSSFEDHRISLRALKPAGMLLLPRPYPGFLPLWFRSGASTPDWSTLERIQVLILGEGPSEADVEAIWLES